MSARLFSDDHIRAILSVAPQRGRDAAPVALSSDIRPAARPDADAGLSGESQKFLAAWRSWRGTQLLPHRHQVQLTSIARLMPQLAVLEIRSPDRAIFRLAGTEIEAQFGARLTGRSYIALAEPAEQKRRGDLLWLQVSQPCAAIVYQEFEFRSGRREIIEIASAPVLPDTDGQPVQIFAVASRLPRYVEPAPGKERDMVVRNFGRNLRFVDVGAGVPRTV